MNIPDNQAHHHHHQLLAVPPSSPSAADINRLQNGSIYSQTTNLQLGRSPLSAKLAAYGETLTLKRGLKLVEEKSRVGGEGPEDKKGPVRGWVVGGAGALVYGIADLAAATA
jgi:hypothetical protein